MKHLFVLGLLISLSFLSSAEIKNGQLYLEVFILNGQQITVSTSGNINISEIGSPVSRSYQGDITLQLISKDEQLMWGFINRSEIIIPDSVSIYTDENIKEKFIWQDGRLAIQYEKLTFEDKYFPNQEAAEQYAVETGYSLNQIKAIPLQNAGLKVTNGNGVSHFYQLPVSINCVDTVKFNKSKGEYIGTFILKNNQGKLSVTNLLDIENYVAGVVPNEIGNLAPEEALKTQAVAARTHAVSLLLMNRHINDGYDLCNSTHCQVHKGNFLREPQIDKAVHDTKNIVMFYNDKIADAVYHSNCGGKTDTNQNAWSGKPIPYLQGVACYPELDSIDLSIEQNAVNWINQTPDTNSMSSWEKRSELWDKTISRGTLEMNSGVRNPGMVTVLRRGASGRILRLKISGSTEETFSGEYKIRQVFGGLPSSFFYIDNGASTGKGNYTLESNISIKGKGFGHGVGLCQVGALQKARNGWTWEDLIKYYYPGVNLTTEWLNTNTINHLGQGSD